MARHSTGGFAWDESPVQTGGKHRRPKHRLNTRFSDMIRRDTRAVRHWQGGGCRSIRSVDGRERLNPHLVTCTSCSARHKA